MSDDIQRKQKAAEKTETAIDEARVSYQPVAAHTSVLFFCVADMAAIDPMYQYSLTYFVALFLRSIDASPRSSDLPTRLKNLTDHFTFFLFVNVCRSLFAKDKLLFAFTLSTKLAMARTLVRAAELRFLLTGGIAVETAHINPAPAWLSDKAWGEICRMDDLGGAYEGVRDAVASGLNDWKRCDALSPLFAQRRIVLHLWLLYQSFLGV